MLNKKDLRIEHYRASGNGGQNRDKVSSAVRITHIPTGLVAQSQDQRDQAQNYKIALKVLTERVDDGILEKKKAEREFLRQSLNQGRVRTYNFVTKTVTDHRTGNRARLDDVLDGNLDLVVQ